MVRMTSGTIGAAAQRQGWLKIARTTGVAVVPVSSVR